jgi:TnpA family transposase
MTERKIIFTDAERKRLTQFPTQIPSEDLITYFTLTGSDKTVVNLRRGEHNRLGFALQLSSLRYLGFCPDDLHTISSEALHYLSQQLGCNDPLGLLSLYGEREHTRTDHFQIIQEYLRFRKAGPSDLENLSAWLIERASEHDKPTLLFRMACERLFSDRIVRPGITTLEKMIISAKQQAQEKIYHRICSLLTDNRKIFLDDLLIPNSSMGRTPLFWLRYGATANTPKAILRNSAKLTFFTSPGVAQTIVPLGLAVAFGSVCRNGCGV